MTHRYIKITATAVVLASAFGFMLWSTLRDGAEYFKHVDEVVAQRPALEGKQLQMHGYVIPGSRMNKPNTLEWRFKVQNNPIRSGEPGNVMSVSYTGVVPDTFKDEAEVVLKGRLVEDGFHADPNGVIAKCPSKYEAAGKVAAGSAPAGS
jgi:cytochrome c-type biogenesis protein CcmE